MYAPFLTASRVELFARCPASAVLPRVEEESAAAARGTEIHARTLVAGKLPLVFLDWFGREPRYEVALAWHPQTGEAKLLGENLQRSYELDAPGWLTGTADALTIQNGVVSVADLKTGHSQTRGSLGPPEESYQLRTLAWLAWKVAEEKKTPPSCVECLGKGIMPHPTDDRGEPMVTCWVCEGRSADPWRPKRVRLAWFMQPDDGREPWIEDAEVAPDELEAWARKLAQRVEAAQAVVPAARPGEWCRFCPSFDACPAQGDALRRLADVDTPIADDEVAAATYRALHDAERQVERAKTALALYVERRGEVPMGGGKSLRLTRSTVRRIDGAQALARGLVPPSAADVSVTQASLQRAGLDPDEALDRLREAGCVTEVQGQPYVRLSRQI